MDPAGDSGHLTDLLIGELAANAVAAKDAKSLALRFMEITAVKVSNMEFDSQSAEELTSSIFRTWRNQSKEANRVKVKLLFRLFSLHSVVMGNCLIGVFLTSSLFVFARKNDGVFFSF